MLQPSFQTLLQITSFGIPLYSARGLTQVFGTIDQASSMRRTVNGYLDDLSLSQFRKYTVKITCTDLASPAVDNMWPGQQVTLFSAAELCYPVGDTPQREAISGSERTDNGFVFYRPVLQMRVTAVTNQLEEWSADVQWEIDLEEI